MRLLILAFTIALAGCAVPKAPPPENSANTASANFTSRASLEFTWEIIPSETETGSFRFLIYRTNPVDGTRVPQDPSGALNVFLWMPSMGHGSSPVTVERLDVGEFRATKVFFIMKGEWEIHLQVKSGKDVIDEAVVPYLF